MARVQGCCVGARQPLLLAVCSLRTPSARSPIRQPETWSWVVRGAEPLLRPATGCFGAVGLDVSHSKGLGVRFPGWGGWLRRAKSCGWSPGGHGAAVSRAGSLSPGRRARRESPGAPRDCQQREPAEARQALSAERDAYKPRAAILFLLRGLPFPSPGAQCAAVAAVSPLALPLLGRPPGGQPGAAWEVPSGKVPPAPASTALAFSLPPPP